MVRILIGGDLCPIGCNMPAFEKGDADAIFHDLLPEFQQADLSIVNLECPLIRCDSRIEKTGPIVGVSNNCIKGKQALMY